MGKEGEGMCSIRSLCQNAGGLIICINCVSFFLVVVVGKL